MAAQPPAQPPVMDAAQFQQPLSAPLTPQPAQAAAFTLTPGQVNPNQMIVHVLSLCHLSPLPVT